MFPRTFLAIATFLAFSCLFFTTGCGGKQDADPSGKTMRVTVDVTGMT